MQLLPSLASWPVKAANFLGANPLYNRYASVLAISVLQILEATLPLPQRAVLQEASVQFSELLLFPSPFFPPIVPPAMPILAAANVGHMRRSGQQTHELVPSAPPCVG